MIVPFHGAVLVLALLMLFLLQQALVVPLRGRGICRCFFFAIVADNMADDTVAPLLLRIFFVGSFLLLRLLLLLQVGYVGEFIHQEPSFGRVERQTYFMLLMEFCPLGDLKRLIERRYRALTERRVRDTPHELNFLQQHQLQTQQ